MVPFVEELCGLYEEEVSGYSTRIADLEKCLDNLRGEYAELQTAADQAASTITDLNGEHEEEVTELRTKLQTSERQVSDYSTRVTRLEGDLVPLQGTIRGLRQEFDGLKTSTANASQLLTDCHDARSQLADDITTYEASLDTHKQAQKTLHEDVEFMIEEFGNLRQSLDSVRALGERLESAQSQLRDRGTDMGNLRQNLSDGATTLERVAADVRAQQVKGQSVADGLAALEASVGQEMERLTEEVKELQAQLRDRNTVARQRETELQTQLQDQKAAATNREAELQTQLQDRNTAAVQREGELQTQLQDQNTTATNREAELSEVVESLKLGLAAAQDETEEEKRKVGDEQETSLRLRSRLANAMDEVRRLKGENSNLTAQLLHLETEHDADDLLVDEMNNNADQAAQRVDQLTQQLNQAEADRDHSKTLVQSLKMNIGKLTQNYQRALQKPKRVVKSFYEMKERIERFPLLLGADRDAAPRVSDRSRGTPGGED